MPATVSQKMRDGATTLSSISLVIAGTAIIDENMRRFLGRLVHGDFNMAAMLPDIPIHHITGTVLDLVGRDHVELAAYGVAGFVLFLLMFKT